jgi:hypothetical protein
MYVTTVVVIIGKRELARFGYRLIRKTYIFFGDPFGTYCLNMTISEIVFSKFGTL